MRKLDGTKRRVSSGKAVIAKRARSSGIAARERLFICGFTQRLTSRILHGKADRRRVASGHRRELQAAASGRDMIATRAKGQKDGDHSRSANLDAEHQPAEERRQRHKKYRLEAGALGRRYAPVRWFAGHTRQTGGTESHAFQSNSFRQSADFGPGSGKQRGGNEKNGGPTNTTARPRPALPARAGR